MSKLAQYQRFRQELGQLLVQYKGYGFVLGFLLNLSIWHIASQFVADPFVSNFWNQVFVSLLFSAVFCLRSERTVS
ncbi:hypothetical protein CBQ28_06625 [Pseudoalteromonas sp. GCY]|uniref:hypothetical protein n=1 Tax=Pseudoalteromonas sp. GCY TaxID=2003316 RepID=UPI000BFED15F|nr:hypothetical protein [Pseudoalteromonas sp. GCY]PHI37851.1 hypothetical protein CBQ28_06625 [Pseudoalteromonas sp. GCY]QQQ64976.1 hypothetical protein JJQ94_05080 [Pseudoalteromonas sp. GCY]